MGQQIISKVPRNRVVGNQRLGSPNRTSGPVGEFTAAGWELGGAGPWRELGHLRQVAKGRYVVG
jgi:hypothetical protein